MDKEYGVILNAIKYNKWQVFGKVCRFFGVDHFDEDIEDPLIRKCFFDPDISLIDYIKEKIKDNMNFEGILDIYSENYYWTKNSKVAYNKIDKLYNHNSDDILEQIDNSFFDCFYESKKNRETFKNVCPFYMKEDKRVNSRFHTVDVRNRFNNFNLPNIYDTYSLVDTFKKTQVLEIILERIKIFVKAVIVGNFSKDTKITYGLDKNSYEFKYLNTLFSYQGQKKALSCKFDSKNCSKISSQYRKLRESAVGNNICEKILEFYMNKISGYMTELRNFGNKLRNKREKPKYYNDIIIFIICVEMDLYFLGRFFYNIINNEEPSKNIIVVAGAEHVNFYREILMFLEQNFEFTEILNSSSLDGDNCVKIN